MSELLSRRALVARGLVGAGGLLGARLLLGPGRALASTLPELPSTGGDQLVAKLLPTAAHIERYVQRMVGFGPRLTGSKAHNRYIAWLQKSLGEAGCELLAPDHHPLTLWQAHSYGLEVLGATPQTIPVASYFPRSGSTPAAGVTGKLAYLGAVPAVGISPGEPGGIAAVAERYAEGLEAWLQAAIAGAGAGLRGSVVMIDLPLPLPLTTAIFAPMTDYDYAPEAPGGVGFDEDYKRLWIAGGGGLEQLKEAGAVGAVFSFDASPAAMAGQYVPFNSSGPGLPALNLDREAANTLRALAKENPSVRLTLTATAQATTSPSIVGVMGGDGSTDEVMVLNTHTDGQNFVEENGGIALLCLARYFNALPAGKRLKRTLVFSAVTGHMAPNMPQTKGFIEDHPDLVARTVAAITLEHLGVTEWIDSPSAGYHEESEYESGGAYCSTSEMLVPLINSISEHQINNTAVLHGPVYFGIGGPFFEAGIPSIGYLTGPNYLVQIAQNGCIDKLNAPLFARQVAWYADLITRYDTMSAEELKTGEPLAGL